MGTNYYIKGYLKTDRDGEHVYENTDPAVHIGKRSAAGTYCFDCGVSLCKAGANNVHQSMREWHERCPQCGKEPTLETLRTSTAGLELGFNPNQAVKRQGVRSCSSWTWAMDMEDGMAQRIQEMGWKLNEKCIVDEYGREYTTKEFMDLIDACPIHFGHMVGVHFS